MKRIIHHALVVALLWPALIVQAVVGTVSSPILIVRIQVGTASSASEEYVELYNRTDAPVNISNWQLQYKSATGSSWTAKVTLHGTLYAHKHYLITSTGYLDELADDHFSAGLASTAGHVRIVQLGITASDPVTVQDTIGWGSTANGAEGNQPALAPASSEALVRKVNDSAEYIDSDVNLADFAISTTSQPVSDNEPPAGDPSVIDQSPAPTTTSPPDQTTTSPPLTTNTQSSSTSDTLGDTTQAASIPLLVINEILPNPKAPQTDAQDEFVEIYNPNPDDISLDGYIIQTGTNFSHSQPLGGQHIVANGYLVLTSGTTSIVLSNTISNVRLLGPDGQTIGATVSYEGGPDGQAWAYDGRQWLWTITPTPGAPNQMVAPPVITKASGLSGAVKSSKASSKGTSTSKSTAATSKTKASSSSNARTEISDPPLAPAQPVNLRLIGLAVTGAILYGALEYRHDVSNAFYRFRRNRSARRATGTSLSWR